MSIYDFDTGIFVDNNLPPDKRKPNFSVTVFSLLSGLKYNNDKYKLYREGDLYIPWLSATSYSIDDVVTYQGMNYISLQNSNVGNRPIASPLYWLVINQSSIGADERVRYQPNKLIFEYALNRYFGTTFRQPDDVSDIYITNASFFNQSFIVGGIESNSSIIYKGTSTGYVINDYFVQLGYSFVINIPASVYADLGGSDTIVRNFADKIVPAGKNYIILTY